MSAPRPIRDFGLVQRVREEDEELQKPLEWGLVRRLFGYTAPIKGKVVALAVLTIVRSAQLPALGWIMALVINGPISGRDVPGLTLGIVIYGIVALTADGLFHFRQRFALEIGDLGAQDELLALEDAIDRGADLSADRSVLGLEVEKRNLHVLEQRGSRRGAAQRKRRAERAARRDDQIMI